MVRRTARRGPNAGNDFWGCSKYASTRCHGTRPYVASAQNVPSAASDTSHQLDREEEHHTAEPQIQQQTASKAGSREYPDRLPPIPRRPLTPSTSSAQNQSSRTTTASAPQLSELQHPYDGLRSKLRANAESRSRPDSFAAMPQPHLKRVEWHDATMLNRPGWRSYYATVGASLWSVQSDHWGLLSNCWVACEDSNRSNPDPRLLQVAAAMRKLLARGISPPLHPRAERILLNELEIAGDLDKNAFSDDAAGDMRPTLKQPPMLQADDFAVPPGSGHSIFDHSLVESSAESDLVAWMDERAPGSVRWLVPQPSLKALTEVAGSARGTAAGQSASEAGIGYSRGSRCDFLFAPQFMESAVIEVDGSQHGSQRALDQSRDELLSGTGLETIRVPTSELRSKAGPGITTLGSMLDRLLRQSGRSTRSGSLHRLLAWAPVQTHRLVLGLCEAMVGGFLSGTHWNVAVQGPTDLATDLAVRLIGPYLEMFDALDMMWGERTAAPGMWRASSAMAESSYGSVRRPSATNVWQMVVLLSARTQQMPVSATRKKSDRTPAGRH